jgi:hypothetical protein
MIGGGVDYSDPRTQEDIESMLHSLESSKYFREDAYTQAWLRNFISYVQLRNDLKSPKESYLDISNKTDFINILQEVRLSNKLL